MYSEKLKNRTTASASSASRVILVVGSSGDRSIRLTANAVGFGFRSIRHVLITPQVAFFQKVFPDLPPERLNTVFNRFAHVS